MIKTVFWVALGAVGALQAERWLAGLKHRFSARSMTDGLLDRVNRRFEQERARTL